MSDTTLPFLPFARPDIGDAEIAAVTEALRSGWVTTGPQARAFEQAFTDYLGGNGLQSIAVNSATAGLHLALEALGIGPGDEVIAPTLTFTATVEVVRYLGADPVLVDVDPVTLNIDPEAIRTAITPRTKAIMPVHYGGLFPEESRAIFVRDALLTGEINTRSPFLPRNLRTLEQAKEEEAKQRRVGLVVDEDWQARWYLDRLPPHVHNAQALAGRFASRALNQPPGARVQAAASVHAAPWHRAPLHGRHQTGAFQSPRHQGLQSRTRRCPRVCRRCHLWVRPHR